MKWCAGDQRHSPLHVREPDSDGERREALRAVFDRCSACERRIGQWRKHLQAGLQQRSMAQGGDFFLVERGTIDQDVLEVDYGFACISGAADREFRHHPSRTPPTIRTRRFALLLATASWPTRRSWPTRMTSAVTSVTIASALVIGLACVMGRDYTG